MPARLPYGPEPDAPVRFTLRFALVLLAIPAITVLLFFIDPEGPVLVGLLALLFLAVVFAGVGSALTRKSLSRGPRRTTGS
ncbi:hypothetical protein DSM112329_03863 [Paraconexibacter sp. AEG42_29]|uniref:Integral membrane protein n=1 Tax=Paraconexibacter sp. AEG42_29 TaxID=2997339 RepID=A0AAU7AZ29_9ACTN